MIYTNTILAITCVVLLSFICYAIYLATRWLDTRSTGENLNRFIRDGKLQMTEYPRDFISPVDSTTLMFMEHVHNKMVAGIQSCLLEIDNLKMDKAIRENKQEEEKVGIKSQYPHWDEVPSPKNLIFHDPCRMMGEDEFKRMYVGNWEPEKTYHPLFTDKSVCITGTFNKFTKQGVRDQIGRFGGIPTASVSSKTDVLIYGYNNGTLGGGAKYKKAESLGIRMLSEAEFISVLGGLPNRADRIKATPATTQPQQTN